MISVVLRAIPTGGGKELAPGTIVDSSGWRNEAQLERNKNIRAATNAEIARAEKKTKASKPRAAKAVRGTKRKRAKKPASKRARKTGSASAAA